MKIKGNCTLFACCIYMFAVNSDVSAQANEDIVEYSEEIPSRLINFIDFSLDPVYPIYSFGELVDDNLFGLSLSYLRQRKQGRFDYFGVQFSYTHVGSLTRSFLDFEDRTGTNIMSLHFLYRYYPDFFFWRVEPFLEVGFGPQAIYTVTTTTFFLDDSVNLNFEEFDMGISYSVGMGFNFYISGQFFFLSKLGFNGGSAVSYFVPEEYVQGLPFDNFRAETSAINFLRWQLGVAVSF